MFEAPPAQPRDASALFGDAPGADDDFFGSSAQAAPMAAAPPVAGPPPMAAAPPAQAPQRDAAALFGDAPTADDDFFGGAAAAQGAMLGARARGGQQRCDIPGLVRRSLCG